MKLLDKDGLTYYTSKIKNELTDYVKNTDYASASKGGVIKTGKCLGLNNGVVYATTLSYSNYTSAGNDNFVSKGTLENVLTAKIGDIQTLLDNLNTGSGV